MNDPKETLRQMTAHLPRREPTDHERVAIENIRLRRRVGELEGAAREALETGPCHSECFTSLESLRAAMASVCTTEEKTNGVVSKVSTEASPPAERSSALRSQLGGDVLPEGPGHGVHRGAQPENGAMVAGVACPSEATTSQCELCGTANGLAHKNFCDGDWSDMKPVQRPNEAKLTPELVAAIAADDDACSDKAYPTEDEARYCPHYGDIEDRRGCCFCNRRPAKPKSSTDPAYQRPETAISAAELKASEALAKAVSAYIDAWWDTDREECVALDQALASWKRASCNRRLATPTGSTAT